MKSIVSLFILLLFGTVAAASLSAAEQLWTCGMHPQIVKKEPGNCPICGMKLVPVHANGAHVAAGAADQSGETDAVKIRIDGATVQRMNLRTAPVERGPVRREIRTVGTVTYNEEGLRDITLKYEGWLEKVFVNTTWASVKAGEPLFEIYSPGLYNAELNYLVAVRSEGGTSGALTRAALARLQLFDVPEATIEELKRTKEAKRTLVYRAPADGVVIEKMGLVGQMMKAGERIYRLADLSSVWVEAEIYEKDLPFVHQGAPATVWTSYGPERSFDGRVDLLLPQVQEQTRTATARIVLANPDLFLRPGMYVDVRFSSELKPDAVLVPDLAVLRSGERNTVFVALEGGLFEPRDVELGVRSEGDFYEVLRGLSAGERVVTSGQFMLDSESQLREAIQKMVKPGATPTNPDRSRGSDHRPSAAEVNGAASLEALARAAADAAVALARDDFAAYRELLPELRVKLKAGFVADAGRVPVALRPFRSGLAEPSDLTAARKQFAPFSTAVADAIREAGLAAKAGLHVFECPMAKARWVQRNSGIRNPFYGEAMPACGEELAAPEKTTRA